MGLLRDQWRFGLLLYQFEKSTKWKILILYVVYI